MRKEEKAHGGHDGARAVQTYVVERSYRTVYNESLFSCTGKRQLCLRCFADLLGLQSLEPLEPRWSFAGASLESEIMFHDPATRPSEDFAGTPRSCRGTRRHADRK